MKNVGFLFFCVVHVERKRKKRMRVAYFEGLVIGLKQGKIPY